MIQTIVEGHGEVQAVPILLRRLIPELGVTVEIGGQPIRQNRAEIVREATFKRAIQLAQLKPRISSVLVLFDLDDDCAQAHIPQLPRWANEIAPNLPSAVILARREYEAWFLASLESLRGVRRIREDAYFHDDPEAKRGAKEAISLFMPKNAPYTATADQPAITAAFDLGQAYRRCSSFRKLAHELCRVLTELGQQPSIPEDWKTH